MFIRLTALLQQQFILTAVGKTKKRKFEYKANKENKDSAANSRNSKAKKVIDNFKFSPIVANNKITIN